MRRRSLLPVLAAALALFAGAACSGGEGDRATFVPPKDQNPAPSSSTTSEPVPTSCTDGARRSCSYYLPSHGGVETCVPGVRICVESTWGPCVTLAPGETVDGGPLDDAGAAHDAG